MKKLLVLLLAGVVSLSLVACSAKEETVEETTTEETTEEVTEATGVYKVYNTTGEKVTELYVYEVGSADKGENLAGEGMRNTRSTVVEFTAMSDAVLVLEYVTESGRTGTFETLHIEEAPIALLAEDSMTGATQIAFTTPMGTGVYDVYNVTGETVTELYLTPAGEEKGENLAGEGMSTEDVLTLTFEGPVDSVLVLEFVTESGVTGKFETLHIEEAPISLLAEDARTGATEISFTKPE